MIELRPPPPPDAGASFLGAHGLRNPVVAWLLRKHPELVALTPKAMIARTAPPRCPDPYCRRPMVFRPDAWKCYYHESPVIVEEPWLLRAPAGDVLRRIHEPLDILYEDGAWEIRTLELPDAK